MQFFRVDTTVMAHTELSLGSLAVINLTQTHAVLHQCTDIYINTTMQHVCVSFNKKADGATLTAIIYMINA